MTQFKTASSPLLFLASFFMMLILSSSVSAKNSDIDVAEKHVVDVTTRIANLLEQNKSQYVSDENALYAMVRREVLPLIDFNAMSKLALGKHWRTASPAQRTRFISAFREMLVKSYAKTMIKYTGAKIRSGNSAPNRKPGYFLIRTIVTPRGNSAISANYSLRKVNNDWKAYNVEIGGINLITNFRTNFTREVSAKGLNALIARLEKAGR
ncbi:MAG: ABC transporter substrate-binding protein [Cocleimonas sp.]